MSELEEHLSLTYSGLYISPKLKAYFQITQDVKAIPLMANGEIALINITHKLQLRFTGDLVCDNNQAYTCEDWENWGDEIKKSNVPYEMQGLINYHNGEAVVQNC